jgi:enoyl-CoA hydratase
MRYMLSGETFDATTAKLLNIVSDVVEPGQELEHTIRVAAKVASAAPLAVRSTLASANQARPRATTLRSRS